MSDSESGGATVDVAHYNFLHAVYRNNTADVPWGAFTSTVVTEPLAVGRQLFALTFWSNYVQVGLYRNNTSAVQNVLLRGNTYYWLGVVSDKHYISAVTFGEDDVFNSPFLNYLEDGYLINVNDIGDYLDYCQVRRTYELSSPVTSTATVTELRIPYSFLSWFAMDLEHRFYNEDGSLKSDYKSQNYMFSDFEN